jgi:outer membrane protein assembly complex protein YaeT
LFESAAKYEGQRIVAPVQFDPADQPLSAEELKQAIPFEAGARFDLERLRQAIQNLYSTGRFADIAVDVRSEESGIVVRFITKRAYFVGRVIIRGIHAPPNPGEQASATKLRLGYPFHVADAVQATESLQTLLRSNGFYNADITHQVSLRPNVESADIEFNVETGKRAKFSEPVITGVPENADPKIIRATRWRRIYGLLGWRELTQARLTQGIENVRRYYENHGLLDSRVTLTRLQYHEDADTVTPSLDIRTGIKVSVQAPGAHIAQHRLRQLVPIFQEHSIDPDLLLEGQRNLQQYLVGEGYFGAQVTYSLSRPDSTAGELVTYHVQRGDRHRFAHLEIIGNHYFVTDTLRQRLYIQPATFPRFPYGRFSDTYLAQDLQAIRNLYASNGFRNAVVKSRVVDDYRGVKNHLAVVIQIQEGRQSLVSSLQIEGVPREDLAKIESRLASAPGQPYSDANVSDDRANSLDYYYNDGYLNASFDFSATPSATNPYEINLVYVIHPGQQSFVRNVLVTGVQTTRPELVSSRIELKKGQPLSLLAETDTQRQLYELGIFARVNTAIQNPDGDEASKNVLFDIDEARHYSLNVGVGAQIARIGGGVTTLDNPAGTTGFAPRLAFGISRINFLGRGQTLGLQTAVSTIEQRAALTYFIPQFIRSNKLNLTATTLIENSSDIRTFTAHRREAALQLAQRLSRAYTLQYRLVFRNVTLGNLKIDQLLVPLLSQPETVGMGEVSFIQDKRDDPTDAHRGIYTTVDLSYAPSKLGSQTQFARALFRNATYYSVHRDWVFARSTQFGEISRTGGRPSIPLAERLYSGGSTSIRAFPDFQAGPRDPATGFPLGGNALFINNLELRFPLYGDNLAAVLFHDIGNVYDTLGDLSFRYHQRNLQDFDYAVQDVGVGFRYRTPIGPIRLDLSFSPNAPRFYGLKGTEQDYLNGTAIATVQKINAFQFHFSLGQAF